MFKPIAFAVTAALAAPVIAAPAAAPELQQVQAHLAAVSSMTANFTQTDRAGKVLTGVMTMKKPGKIRFQYEKGVPILVVADGNSLYFIDYSVRQLQRWPIGKSPLAVLLDPKRDISPYATLQPTTNPNVISVEVRDPKRPEFGRITMVFAKTPSAPGGLVMQGWVALDSQNNRTTIKLTNQKFNTPVSDGAFKFDDPRRSNARN